MENNDKQELIKKEYDMLCNQIDKSIERSDKYTLQAIAVLLIDVYFQKNVNFYIDIMGLLVALYLLLKIIECRNTTWYKAAYLIVFVNNIDLGLMYEKRMKQLREIAWKSNNHGWKRAGYFVLRLGYKLKNAMIGIFSVILVISYANRNFPYDNYIKWIKLMILISLGIANSIYSVYLVYGGIAMKEFEEKWREIKRKENNRQS